MTLAMKAALSGILCVVAIAVGAAEPETANAPASGAPSAAHGPAHRIDVHHRVLQHDGAGESIYVLFEIPREIT